MSAIWGYIGKKGTIVPGDICSMEEPMHKYKIDRYEQIVRENVYMACGLQYVTPESYKESLPWYDKDNDCIFTADCMLDNRSDLIRELGTGTIDTDLPDGKLIYMAWRKWNISVCNHLLGVFSFAVYEYRTDTFYLFTDHTGSRYIQYYADNDKIFFSTISESITNCVYKDGVKLCEKWLVACEADRSPNLMLFPELTPFADIFSVPFGSYIRITVNPGKGNAVKKVRYWNPGKNLKRIRHKSEEEYRKLFLDTFRICVKDELRSSEETAMLLSSGLDSTSVAAVAGPILQERGKKLYSYTSVPLKDYVSDQDEYYIVNEKDGVEKFCSFFPNIEPSFLDCEGKSVFTELKRFIDITEVPGKSYYNLVWMDEAYQKAAEKHCHVILTGAYGNETISYGIGLSRVYQEFLGGHFFTAYYELKKFKNAWKLSKRGIMKYIESIIKYKIVGDTELVDKKYIRQELIEKHHIRKYANNNAKNGGGTAMDTEKQHYNALISPTLFHMLGLYETKMGLADGIIIRDPTRDVRFIRLCLSLPMSCFSANGIERYMAHVFMKGIVPDVILENWKHRGLQSADMEYRFKKNKDAYLNRKLTEFEKKTLDYFNKEKIEELIHSDDANIYNVIDIMRVVSFNEFIKRNS